MTPLLHELIEHPSRLVRRLGPYAAVSLLPGGSLIALAMYWYRQHQGASPTSSHKDPTATD